MPGTAGLLTAWQAITPVSFGTFHPIQGVPAFMAGPHTHAKDWFPGPQANVGRLCAAARGIIWTILTVTSAKDQIVWAIMMSARAADHCEAKPQFW